MLSWFAFGAKGMAHTPYIKMSAYIDRHTLEVIDVLSFYRVCPQCGGQMMAMVSAYQVDCSWASYLVDI